MLIILEQGRCVSEHSAEYLGRFTTAGGTCYDQFLIQCGNTVQPCTEPFILNRIASPADPAVTSHRLELAYEAGVAHADNT